MNNGEKTLAIVIMAHPERQAMAKALSQELQAPICYDRINNLWDTCRRAWLSQVSVGADYTLVLQDDAIACKGFRKKALAIINAQDKEYMTAFYAGGMARTRVNQALRDGMPYFLSGMIFNEVALCIPTKYIEEMVKFCDDREAKNDHFIQQWAHLKRLKVFYPVPSLIDHRTDTPSIYRRNYGRVGVNDPRKATAFIDTYEKP